MLTFEDLNHVTHIINTKEISNILIHPQHNLYRATLHFLHNHVLTVQIDAYTAEKILKQMESNT